MSTGTQTYVANTEIETQLVIVEAKINKCLTHNLNTYMSLYVFNN